MNISRDEFELVGWMSVSYETDMNYHCVVRINGSYHTLLIQSEPDRYYIRLFEEFSYDGSEVEVKFARVVAKGHSIITDLKESEVFELLTAPDHDDLPETDGPVIMTYLEECPDEYRTDTISYSGKYEDHNFVLWNSEEFLFEEKYIKRTDELALTLRDYHIDAPFEFLRVKIPRNLITEANVDMSSPNRIRSLMILGRYWEHVYLFPKSLKKKLYPNKYSKYLGQR